jgi:hypothetical protein
VAPAVRSQVLKKRERTLAHRYSTLPMQAWTRSQSVVRDMMKREEPIVKTSSRGR